MALILRLTKGSKLTWEEVDGNFEGLADGSLIEAGAIVTASLANGAVTSDKLAANLSITGTLSVGGNVTLTTPLAVAQGGTGQITEAEALGEMTQALTADTSPDPGADYAPVYDASADTGKKVLLADLSFVRGVGGRLTLSSGTPVMTSDDTGNTTIYFTPYNGDVIPIYDGTRMVPTVFAELSQATTDNTKSPAAVANNSNYDLFVWNDAGTIRLSRGPAWSSDTARGTGAGTTELELVKGIYVNKVAITNGPAAQRGTYVGSVRSNGTATIDWKLGSLAAGGGESFLGVWNMYNRVQVSPCVRSSTNTWSYTSSTIRAAENSSTFRISAITGLEEEAYSVRYELFVVSGAVSNGTAGIGINSTNTNHAMGQTLVGTGGNGFCYAGVWGSGPLGFNYFQALDVNGNATDAVTRYGVAADVNTTTRAALSGAFKC